MQEQVHAKMTVVQLKKFAIENDIKPPSGINKPVLLNYILGAMEDKKSGTFNPNFNQNIPVSLVREVHMDNNINYIDHLNQKGWAVVQIPNYVDYSPDFLPGWKNMETDLIEIH